MGLSASLQETLLLKCPSTTDDKKTVVYLEMLEDRYTPRIDLQENDDDNVVLGFGGENVSLFQKITVTDGPEQKEIVPQHIILCLTGEGKLIIYYLASSYLTPTSSSSYSSSRRKPRTPDLYRSTSPPSPRPQLRALLVLSPQEEWWTLLCLR